MKFLQAVTGVAALAAQGKLRHRSVVADTTTELDLALDFILDGDWEAYAEIEKTGRVAIIEATADIYWKEIPWDKDNVKVRVRGMTVWAVTRRYNLVEEGQ